MDETAICLIKCNFSSIGFSNESVNHRPSKYYNLDVILSVCYRINSKRGIIFKGRANKILKEYLIQGYSANAKRIVFLNKTIEIQNKMLASSLSIDEDTLINVIN